GKGEMETYWLMGHAVNERRRPMNRGVAQQPLLFNLRENENRRRSPKTEFLRRVTASQAHRSLDDSTALFNGTIPGKQTLLRVAQESPLTRKRYSAVAPVFTKDTFQSDPWDGNEMGNNVVTADVIDGFNEVFCPTVAEVKLELDLKTNERDVESLLPSALEDVTKPLIHAQRRLEHLKKFKKKYQPWRRSWSADVIDQGSKAAKPSLCNFLRNMPRSPNAAGNLHTLRESDKEESVV
ncbi:uncharacterized protein NPIL_275931, partial [Nephila pilipes]